MGTHRAARWLASIVVLSLCGVAFGQDDDKADGGEKKNNPGKRGAYSVLSWLTGIDETEDEPPSKRRIATERPDFSFATTTVGKGRVVLETGYQYTHDTYLGENSRIHDFPQGLLRMGLFNEWFEIQIGQNWENARTTAPDGTAESAIGFQDMFLGVKLGLTSQDKLLPESSLLVGLTVPTGARSQTNGRAMPNIFWTYAWGFGEDEKYNICGTTGAGQLLEVETHSFTQILQTAEFITNLTPNLTGYVEYACFAPYNAIAQKPEHVIDTGLLYFINDNIQLDVWGGVGLSRAAPDYFVGCGFSIRH